MANTHTILITRELTNSQRSLADKLRLRVIEEPALSIDYRSNWLSVQQSVSESYKVVLVFTSQNGVKGFDQFRQAGVQFPQHSPVYAVGNKTAEALQKIGYEEVTVPEKQDGVGLAHKIIDDFLANPVLKDTTVLHFCGDKRRDELRHYLTESEITIKDIVVYKTELNNMELPDSPVDAILFYSPSSVQAFRQSGGFHQPELPELFAIGPTTAEDLSIESGKHVHISPDPDTDVFLKFVARVLGESDPQNDEKKVPLRRGKAPKAQGDANYLYYNKGLKNLAQKLRNNSTKAEIRLWTELLRGKQTGYTILRQRPVLNYIADFLCKDLKLIIELDGYSHEFEQQYKKDKERQKELEEAGFKILRFTDDEVMNDLRNVESEIMYWIERLESNKGDNSSPPLEGAGR